MICYCVGVYWLEIKDMGIHIFLKSLRAETYIDSGENSCHDYVDVK